MRTLHFDCDCRQCRSRLTDLLRREIEDAVRLTGVTTTGLCRLVAKDPSLHHDITRNGRVLTARTLQRYLDNVRDFICECPPGSTLDPAEESARSADSMICQSCFPGPCSNIRYCSGASRPQGEDLISTK